MRPEPGADSRKVALGSSVDVAVHGGGGDESDATIGPLRILSWGLVGVAVVWGISFALTRREAWVMPRPTKARADLAVIADAFAGFALVRAACRAS